MEKRILSIILLIVVTGCQVCTPSLRPIYTETDTIARDGAVIIFNCKDNKWKK